MPTDTERRDVARSMRETAKGRYDFCAHNIALEIGMDDPSDFDDCFDGEHLEAWRRLADLIEPSTSATPTHLRRVTDASATVGVSQRDALLALADEMERSANETMAHFANFNNRDVIEYARRIREACGEAANGLPARGAARAHAPVGKAQAGGAGRAAGAGARHEKN